MNLIHSIIATGILILVDNKNCGIRINYTLSEFKSYSEIQFLDWLIIIKSIKIAAQVHSISFSFPFSKD